MPKEHNQNQTLMKLGASYNLFDGEELLESSILSIRDNVDYISVVFQTQSNCGKPCNAGLTDILSQLQQKGLIDHIEHYTPSLDKNLHFNETKKRNIGLELSRENGCTHHLSLDTDELYDPEQFYLAKEIIQENDFDSSVCRLVTYYKNNHTILDPMEDYFVSFIYKIRPDVIYRPMSFPVLVDPTRRMDAGKMIEFEVDELVMHHFSYVRRNLRMKLENSSAKTNWNDEMMENVISHFDQWQAGMQALLAPQTYHATKQITPLFNVSV